MNTSTGIRLEKLCTDDAEPLALLANNKRIWDCVRDHMPHPYTLEDARAFIERSEEEEPPHTFAIINAENRLCGVISLIPQDDVYRISAEIGYWIGEPYWGQGIATQAVALMTLYGFEQLNLERIFAGVFDFNLASMKVLEKNGYQKEGVLRKAAIKNGVIRDEHRYAILRKA